ncbi:hypothetical protein F8388_009894 [Cannabis sativa]|uniref:pectinesterase n=1 Tax=Cannabis sativa TaxID=3483 RepID=A0A7J6DM81_CANSA|nr:hypothetical protein G4B88_005495 [Cannabis sativa]KAF4389761.1 hypothetical protein F8388_009894 [Cannabis sativa]
MKFLQYHNFISIITILLLCSASTTYSRDIKHSNIMKYDTLNNVVSKTIIVDKSGHGNFITVQQAIDSVPSNNQLWIRIHVKAGIYNEKVLIPEDKQYIDLEGEGKDTTTISFDAGGDSGMQNTTFTVLADNFMAHDITFQNTYNMGGKGSMRNITWAPAAMIAADKASFYRCGFISLQDTLSDAHGRHYFESCHIQGAIDFIWGDAQSFYQSCSLEVTGSRIGLSYITAQGRNSESDMGGFVFNGCKIFGNGEALLGRAYRAYATVLYYNTYMDNIISPQGWDAWFNTGHETITVDKSGKGDFTTVQQAIDSVPDDNKSWVHIHIKPGNYTEKVSIKREKPFIFLEGESSRNTIIAWGDSGDIVKSPTFSCHADNIVASKIQFKNSYNVNHKKEVRKSSRDDDDAKAITWAPAALVEGDKVSFYGCSFISVQDTLFDALGRHYFEKCYIQGDIDFIFGNAQSYYEKCNLFVSISGSGSNGVGYITAQGRESSNETSGYVFHSNTIKGTGPTLLGRAYRPHSRVLFYKTYMSDIVSPEGWNAWESKGHECVYMIIKMKLNNYNFIFFLILIIFFFLSGTTTSSPAHYSTTKEVTMKTITVDKSGKGDFTTVQQAIDSVPEDNNAWIRIHIKAGTYNEKVSIERRKQFIFLEGERRSTTIIAWGDGGDVVKSPTFSSHADNFVATRITFKNYYNHPVMTNNGDYYKDRDGKKILWAPAALVEGDKASFYDCAFISVQDTLFDALGRHYFQNCYIEGAIDFIFGDAQSFYQKCNLFADTALLGPGQSYGYIAAQGRKNQSESSGYVFFGNTIKGSGPTLLGRAYRPYSRVLFYKTYMSDVVLPPGWDAWNYVSSEKDISFYEEMCFGPGSNKSKRNSYNLMGSKSEVTPALAARIYGDKSAFFDCGFRGVQDTLWDVTGRHYFSNCYIEGAVDFIFGYAQSYYQNTLINVTVGKMMENVKYIGYITAQGRASENDPGGFVFEGGNTFTYAEVHCEGAGSDTSNRVSWEKKLSQSEFNTTYSKSVFINQDNWMQTLPQ